MLYEEIQHLCADFINQGSVFLLYGEEGKMQLHWTGDQRTVHKALEGDVRAAKRLVDDHYPGLIRFLLHLTGRIDIAEEIAQETFVKAWQRLDTYRGRSSFKTWIHTVAYREYLLHCRREAPSLPLDDSLAQPETDFAIGLIDSLAIESAILALPIDHRVAFLLLHVQGLSASEVATILDVPRGTVLSRVAAARTRLGRLLGPAQIRPGEPDPKPLEGAAPYEITSIAS